MNRYAHAYEPADQLTIDDLRAYRAGQLTGAALHRVERLLLENPFYADALDGLDALQQVGANLHTHTRDLHIALEERVEGIAAETATPRRLMPLWVTSAAASILLVVCVALYYFFYVIPNRGHLRAVDAIEPGTVLIDAKALGLTAPDEAPKAAPMPTQPATNVAQVRTRKQPVVRAVPAAERTQLVEATAAKPISVAHNVPDLTIEDTDIMPLPISEADIQRRHAVDTERAFRQ
ncbi:hypothetical protein FAES_2244 [Fibrella aestuarina BUZ 2]|uniref:Uncharacterized protein n=1 Tax=Fibrella aestuarina BUZ 2 TaxID=1166018 RepID=I0K800_9BACT|nr:hypothetical protein [Fibrella aestuarina]CCH00253.1 hypothetical protein FAES_2244 [Fibrella aestuarina BUZ 2]